MKMEKVRSILYKAKEEKRWLLEPEAMEILKTYEISVPEHRFINDIKEAVKSAESIGYPVVLKIVSPAILHKSDADCVKLNLTNGEEVRNAYQEILTNAEKFDPKAEIRGIIIYPMVKAGLETIIGITEDALGKAPQRVRCGGLGPIRVCVPRRGHAKHSGFREGLRRRHGDPAGAELSVDSDDSGCGQRSDLDERVQESQASVDR